jgi:hypothetical protein
MKQTEKGIFTVNFYTLLPLRPFCFSPIPALSPAQGKMVFLDHFNFQENALSESITSSTASAPAAEVFYFLDLISWQGGRVLALFNLFFYLIVNQD